MLKGSLPTKDRYWINARWTLGSVNKIFIVFLIGRDRRHLNSDDIVDPRAEQRHAPAIQSIVIFYTGVFFWALVSVALTTFLALYAFKMALGIDLLEGFSPVPYFFKMIGLCHAICH